MPRDITALEKQREQLEADLSRTEADIAEAEKHLLRGDQVFDRRFADIYCHFQEQRAQTRYELGKVDAMLEDRRARQQETQEVERPEKADAWWRGQAGAAAPATPPTPARQGDWWNDNREQTRKEQEEEPAEDREPTRNR